MKKNCDRCFKNVGDLNWHVKQHRCGNWFYCDFCDYKIKDKRNTDSHQRVHVVGDEKYSCNMCKERFRFSTQRLRHLKKGCVPRQGSSSPTYDWKVTSYCYCIFVKFCGAALFFMLSLYYLITKVFGIPFGIRVILRVSLKTRDSQNVVIKFDLQCILMFFLFFARNSLTWVTIHMETSCRLSRETKALWF